MNIYTKFLIEKKYHSNLTWVSFKLTKVPNILNLIIQIKKKEHIDEN